MSLQTGGQTEAPPRLIPLSKWTEFHVWPTLSAMRHYVHNARKNGFRDFGVVRRVRRRVLIDEAAFFKWVTAQDDLSEQRGEHESHGE